MATETIDWTCATEPPPLTLNEYGWPMSKPIHAYLLPGEQKIVTCERIDEDAPLRWFSNCSERWDVTDKVVLWRDLPADPTPEQLERAMAAVRQKPKPI